VWFRGHPGCRRRRLHGVGYGELRTESLRGLTRPEDEKYATRMAESDPVYAVWGRVGAEASFID
jgi:hypothetical protein